MLTTRTWERPPLLEMTWAVERDRPSMWMFIVFSLGK